MGHPVLREKATPFSRDEIATEAVQRLWRDMLATMVEYEGVGLAAPQVHVSRRLIVVKAGDDEAPIVLFNPTIRPLAPETEVGWEGCLSIPGIRGQVPRHVRLDVQGLGPDGKHLGFESADFPARVIQHEVDHLDGTLFLDRMEDLRTLTFLDEYARYWREDDDEAEEEEA
jgi:peptide deformylase